MCTVDEISEKIKKMSLPELLRLSANALEDTRMTDAHLKFIFIHLEIALDKRKIMQRIGL